VLRYGSSLIVRGLLAAVAAAAVAGNAPAARAAQPAAAAAADTTALVTRNVGSLGLLERDAWYARGISALVTRKDPQADAAYGGDPRRAVEPFLPFEGLVIRNIHLLGREAFGEVALDTTISFMEEPSDELVTRASPFERALNALAHQTREGRVREFLLFREGDPLDPFALADSERLLRQEAAIQDAKIEVVQWEDRPGEVDVLVLVRDRWPWGVRGKVKSADASEVEVFHRNLGGRGLNLEVEALYTRDRSPEVGWRARTSLDNLGGSFVDVAGEAQRTWDEERTAFVAERGFAHPDLRLVGGAGLVARTEYDHPDLPEGASLRTHGRDAWLGWGIPVKQADERHRGRLRLIPAVGIASVDYRDPPYEYATSDDQWRDATRYLGQFSVAGIDYYTTNLVYSYGETEDIPAGMFLGLVGGFEHGEQSDRAYHGIRALWPRFLDGRRYLALDAAFGGFRRHGHFEDGVLDLRLSGFSPLRRQDYGHWRHFYAASYTTGINRVGETPLRLDELSLRDLDSEAVAGQQRLTAGAESILFTPLAFFGFKMAAFGYAEAGFVADEDEALFAQRLNSDVGVGLRLNNPNLVVPTIELRAGALSSEDGQDIVVTVRMGDVRFSGGDPPTPRPSTLAYR